MTRRTVDPSPTALKCSRAISPSWVAAGRPVDGALVGDQVALAEDDELAVDPLDRLHHVRALADDDA